MVGRVVCSLSGRDKGTFMVIVKEDEAYFYLCDGKERPLERPKRKNKKHIALTNTVLEQSSYGTDKQMRKSLAIYRAGEQMRRNQNGERRYD